MKDAFDLKTHKLVPKHILLKPDEVSKVLANYNITLHQLPKISRKDPALAELEVKPGDVMKIIRKSETAGESVYYRVVVYD